MTRRTLGAAALILLLADGSAQAQLSFVFGQNGNEVTEVSGAAGQMVSVQVFLKSVNDTRFDARDLFAAGVRLDTPGGFISAAPTITPNTIANGGPFTTFKTNDQGDPTAATAALQVFADDTTPFAATDRILLGTFTYTAGSTPGSYTITARDMNPTQNDTIATAADFSNLLTVDPPVVTNLTFTITPVPEPVGILAIAGGGLAALRAVRRRRSAAGAGVSG